MMGFMEMDLCCKQYGCGWMMAARVFARMIREEKEMMEVVDECYCSMGCETVRDFGCTRVRACCGGCGCDCSIKARLMEQPVALIVGVTGMAGFSIAEALKKPNALAGPWKVYGAARRPKPSWFPSSTIDQYISFDALNLDDTHQKLVPFSHEITHVFWVAIQARETEEANITYNSMMLDNVLKVLTSSSLSRLKHVTLQTGTKQYMGPLSDDTLRSQLVPHEPPFCEDFPRLPYPNFYYNLEDLLSSYASLFAFTWSVHRSSIIFGASTRSLFNIPLTLAVYAAICKYEGTPFRYPGSKYTWEHFCDMSDARILAEQQIWAAVTDSAKNQAFNCTNGDVFTWKGFWKELSEVFELEFVDTVESFDWVGEMKTKAAVWDAIVEEHGLYKMKMEEVTHLEAIHIILDFKFQHVCSMNKSREFGFFGFVDTIKSVRMWIGKMREMKILP